MNNTVKFIGVVLLIPIVTLVVGSYIYDRWVKPVDLASSGSAIKEDVTLRPININVTVDNSNSNVNNQNNQGSAPVSAVNPTDVKHTYESRSVNNNPKVVTPPNPVRPPLTILSETDEDNSFAGITKYKDTGPKAARPLLTSLPETDEDNEFAGITEDEETGPKPTRPALIRN